MKKLKNIKTIILKAIKEHPGYIFCTILSSVLSSGIAYYPAIIINKQLVNIVTSNVQSNIASIIIAIIFLTLTFELWQMIINKIEFLFIIFQRRQKEKIITTYNAELFSKITSIKGDCLESAEIYELYTRCRNISLPKIIAVPTKIANIVTSILSIILYANILMQVSVYFYIIVIGGAIIKNCLFLKRKKRQYKYDEVINNYSMKLDAFSEIITDKNFMEEIKVYNSLNYINSKRKSLYDKMRLEVWKMSCFDIIFSFANFIIDKGVYYGSYIFLALKRIDSLLTMGEFSSTIASLKQLETSTSKVFSTIGSLIGDFSYYDDYFRFMNSTPLQRNGELIPFATSVEIENLEYAYLSNSFSTLKNLSCNLAPGTKVCIVGKNGSGKSTLAKIISGIYEIYGGKIRINSIDIKSYSALSMIDRIDVCPQDFTKYPFTLKYNIDFDNQDDIKLTNAISKSGVCDFINDLPDYIDTQLDSKYSVNGIDLSDGQWQRILLARIFFADKNIIVFDEPTSSLDPIMENQIFNELLKIRDRLVIIVSHRMSCAKAMDQIIVLDDGQIVEAGTHFDLMNNKGFYFEMFTSQANKYEIDI